MVNVRWNFRPGFVGLIVLAVALGGVAGCKKMVMKETGGSGSGGATSSGNPITLPVTCFITSAIPYWRNVTSETVTYSCSHNLGGTLATRECQLDAGPWGPCDTPFSHSLASLGEGLHAFRVRATDTAMPVPNVGQSNDLIWNVDTIPPSMTSGGNALVTQGGGNASFSFSGQDNLGGSGVQKFQCRLLNLAVNWADCTSPKAFGGLSGVTGYTFQTRAIDFAGNVSAPEDLAFTSNPTVASGTCVIGNIPSPIKVKSQVGSFTCSSANPITAYECRVNGGSWVACQTNTSHSMSNLPEGSNLFEVRFKDGFGNTSQSVSKNFTVDSIPPTVAITDHDVVTLVPNFSFEGSDPGGSGIKEYRCKLSEGANIISDWTVCSSPNFYSSGVVPGKNYLFQVKAFDNADNESNTAQYAWLSAPDNAPSCTILTSYPVGPGGIAFRKNASETLTFSCTSPDPSLTTECRTNSGSWVACTSGSTHQLSGLSSGSLYTFDVRARDSFGNQGSPSSVLSWRVDLSAPITNVLPVESDNPSAKISFDATDTGGSGIQKIECAVDGLQAYSTCTSPLNLGGLVLNHTYTFRARATDFAGNVGPEVVRTWTSVPGIPGPACSLAFNVTPPNYTSQLQQLFNINCTGSDTLGAIQYSLDGAAWTDLFVYSPTVAMPKAVSVMAQSSTTGTKRLYIRGRNSQLKYGVSDSKSWNIDISPPSAVINQLVIGPSGTEVTFSASDIGGSGVVERWCQLDGLSSYALCTSPVTYAGKGNTLGSSYTFRVKAKDGTGNWSTEAVYSWTNAVNDGWSNWSACSASCGGGTQTRTCAQPQSGFLFSGCNAGNTQTQSCNPQACYVAPTKHPSGYLLCSGCGDPPGNLSSDDCSSSDHVYSDSNWNCQSGQIRLKNPHSYQSKRAGLQCGVGGNPAGHGKDYDDWDVYCN